MKKMLLVVIFGMILVSCTTMPVKYNEASNVPSSRLYAYKIKTSETTATIIAIRDTGFVGSACLNAFYIDNKLAARFDTGEKATFFVNPNEHTLKFGPDPQSKGLCSVGADYHYMQIETYLKAGSTKQFNLRLMATGIPSIQIAD